MEPNKLENEIREKLGKREIHPSAQAWDRLDAMLSVQESKVEKKPFPWMRIAAGIVLFLGVSYFFFNSNEEKILQNNSNVIVNKEVNESSNNEVGKTNIIESNKTIIDEKNSSVAYSESKSKVEVQNEKRKRFNNSISKGSLPIEENDYQVANSDKKNDIKNIEEKSEQKIIQDNNEVVAEVKTPAEKPKLKIDPSTLLNQVDGEIQLTFRQKVMKTVTKGYKEAKEAVVSRNQESSINH